MVAQFKLGDSICFGPGFCFILCLAGFCLCEGWWFSVFSWGNLYFGCMFIGKPIFALYFSRKTCALICFLFFTGKLVFLFVFMGLEGKEVGTERKNDRTKEQRIEIETTEIIKGRKKRENEIHKERHR